MSITEHRLSTTVIPEDWLPPDERDRSFKEDFEKGPLALNDTSLGVDYQVWYLTWNSSTDDLIVTPETSGSPVIVLNVADIEQCSLAFDQNAHVTIAYIAAGQAYLYWYDTVAGMWVTDALASDVVSVMLQLDDKRPTQTSANDIILWYTTDEGDGTYNLYTREQRDRFLDEYEMKVGCLKYINKVGMHEGLRGQILLSSPGSIFVPPVLPPGPPDPQANLDFEFGDAYWIKIGDFTIDGTDPYEGSYSGILTTTVLDYSSLENSVYTLITPEDPVFVSCMAKGSVATQIKLGVKVYNSAKALIATQIVSKAITTDWTQLVHSFLTSPSAVYVRIFVESDSTDGVISFDNFSYFPVLDVGTFYTVDLAASVYMQVELNEPTLFEVEV